ncbi:MAG: hypothetical protein JNM93_00470 [Bacteriovoracaceae bacterium]|nr:hypothetical protein [Bacteriovoracaceae bacterium]
MYDYSKSEIHKIENVEHEIHILGVKVPAMPWCIYIFLGFLIINPFLAFLVTFAFIGIVRKFYFAEKAGTPIEYQGWFIKLSNSLPLIKDLFPSLDHLSQSEVYRD